ncbi:transcription initiation factor IIF, beta subunit-domain-containing protein [Bombardia bombarda]|uniref:Transcription initiation factor IIF subunit beta n=1 Tax=Bombardia bombarda TaxID=252184 RepID=A0AA39T2L9_9PEZI|nr:transcription initiation factor IIF, beta subunit-domain-containing protein [Bombardia bombarda]
MAEPARIKPEPDADSPMADDEPEESADLGFYDKNIQNDTFGRLYLTRIPAYVWQAWSKLDDDAEIEIGRIRQWTEPDGNSKLQMLLRSDIEPHKNLPKEYNMEVADGYVENTFVFTEQDQPSYAAKNKERAAQLARGVPSQLLRQQQQKMQDSQPHERGKARQPYTRRGVPKRTTIAGTLKHEVVCTPLANAESDKYTKRVAKKAAEPAAKVRIMGRLPPNGGLNDAGQWMAFFKTQAPPTKAKKMDNKTARWSENVLIDAIVDCFAEHKYWAIKTFRARVHQPEAFIRECLEKIAVLHRSGTFAHHWSLKPEYQNLLETKNAKPKDDAADVKTDYNTGSDDEDEEDIRMEDVF